jgi:O-antigen/teichoic acid export membrane protein
LIKENYKNIIYTTTAQIIPRAMLFIFTFYLARTLGSAEYGRYDFALSIGYLVGVFFELGGNMILTKHIARGFYSSFKYALNIRFVSIISAVIVTITVLLVFNLYSDNFINIIYALIGIAFSSLMNLYFSFFRGIRQMNFEAVVLIVQKIIFIGVCFFLLNYGNFASNALVAFSLSMIVSYLLIQTIYLRERKKYSDAVENKIILKDYVKDIVTLALVEVFSIIYFRVTQIILENYHGVSAVGVYGASYKLIEVFTNIPAILMIVLFPGFAKLSKDNIAGFKNNFKKVLPILFGLGILSSIFCWLGGEYIFKLLGKDYSESYILLRYMTLALTAIFPNYLLTQGLIALDKNTKYAVVLSAALVLNVVMGILIVPKYGAEGSALSVGICEWVIFIACFILINKEMKSRIGETA